MAAFVVAAVVAAAAVIEKRQGRAVANSIDLLQLNHSPCCEHSIKLTHTNTH